MNRAARSVGCSAERQQQGSSSAGTSCAGSEKSLRAGLGCIRGHDVLVWISLNLSLSSEHALRPATTTSSARRQNRHLLPTKVSKRQRQVSKMVLDENGGHRVFCMMMSDAGP